MVKLFSFLNLPKPCFCLQITDCVYIRFMSFNWKNFVFRIYLKYTFSPDFSAEKSIRHQQKIFRKIIRQLSNTQLGRDLKFAEIKSYRDFQRTVPVTQYDFYENYIEKIKAGEQNVMTDQPVKLFAKTAGTTSGKSKLVPITTQIMKQCHVRGSFFALGRLVRKKRAARCFAALHA